MTHRPLSAIALAVLVAVFAVACGGRDSANKTGAAAPKVTGADVARQLTNAGVPVVKQPTSNPNRFELLQQQADAMALEASVHGGIAGAQLDAAAPGSGALPASYLLAGYVTSGATAGAKWAQQRIGTVNWKAPTRVVFPTAVLALFVGDVLQQATPGGPGKAARVATPFAGTRVMANGVCSSLANWVQDVLDSLFNALKFDASGGGFTGTLASIWNAAVDLAQGVIQGAIKAVTQPVIDAVTGILAVLGTVSMAVSLLKPWTLSVTADPATVKFGVNAPGEQGAFAVKAEGPSDPWPSDVRDCAQLAGVDLPDPSDVSGAKVQWTTNGFPPFGEELARTDVLGKDGTASLQFRAATESSAKGPLITDTASATVAVTRTDIEKLRALLTNLLFGGLPGILGQAATAIVNALTQPVIDQIAAMVSPGGSGSVSITHHGPEEECSPPPPGRIPDGKWSGPISLGVAGQPFSLSGVVLTAGGGQAELSAANNTVTGTWAMTASGSGTLSGKDVSGTLNPSSLTIANGVVSGDSAAPVLTGDGTLQGSITVSAAGQTFDVPLNETHPATATMTITKVTCTEVVATLIPSFNAQGAGAVSFSGEATWTAHKD